MSNPPGKPAPPVASADCEVIHVPNTLAMKVGPNFKLSAAASIQKADNALKSLSANFGAWLEQEIAGLEAVRGELKQAGLNAEVAGKLSTKALDLKGLGTTYDHPLASRIGGSLFRLLDEVKPVNVPLALVDAHVDAVRAIVRSQIRDAAHPVGMALVSELERRVSEITAKAA